MQAVVLLRKGSYTTESFTNLGTEKWDIIQIGETSFKIKKNKQTSVQSFALTICSANGFDKAHFKMQETYKIGLEFSETDVAPLTHARLQLLLAMF